MFGNTTQNTVVRWNENWERNYPNGTAKNGLTKIVPFLPFLLLVICLFIVVVVVVVVVVVSEIESDSHFAFYFYKN